MTEAIVILALLGIIVVLALLLASEGAQNKKHLEHISDLSTQLGKVEGELFVLRLKVNTRMK